MNSTSTLNQAETKPSLLTEEELVSTLLPLNGVHFHENDLYGYAHRLLTRGKAIYIRGNSGLVSYVIYNENETEVSIEAIWTDPKFQNRGHATHLLNGLIIGNAKPITLEVSIDNPAKILYSKLGFKCIESNDIRERMAIGRRVAIMQPYIYPYLGYFHLINASDLFIFYDDVHYIKRGRINRNNILLNGKEYCFTLPVIDASQNKLIKDTFANISSHWKDTFLKRLTYAYKKAPYFNQVIDSISDTLDIGSGSIADLSIASVISASNYIGEKINYVKSSIFSPETQGMEKSERLIAITKKAGGQRYVNSIGGQKLYNKHHFKQKGVELSFIKSENIEYAQYGEPNSFVPKLSIIDVMMFNHRDAIKEFCTQYSLV